jgi:hypothetical protein
MRDIYVLHLRFTTYLSELSLNRTLWLVAKIIQAIGLFEVLYGLIVGLKDGNLRLEFRYAGIGLLIFGVGWLIEKKLGGR